MEDVEFNESHSNSPLPEAGHDPDDPLRPEIDEENSTPNPPIADPQEDMEVAEDKEGMPLQDDIEEAGLSDAESALSELDEDQFGDFDAADIAIDAGGPGVIDETNVNLIGVHKRKRTEGEGETQGKKKKKRDNRRERGRRKKGGDEDGVEEGEGRKSRKRKEGRIRGASPEEEDETNLTPEERRKRALDRAMDEAVKRSGTRRRKKDGIDLEQMADQEIEEMRRRMAQAAQADNEGRERGEPAQHKLKLLPEVVNLLNRTNIKDQLVDPDINLLEAVRFFLEPLSDGSLPAYNIQRDLFTCLTKLKIDNKDALVASGIGKVIMFYCKSKRPELAIKRQAERLFTEWTRPILKRTDDYRKKEFIQADYDPSALPVRTAANPANTAAVARAKALETPRVWNRARMEAGPTTYTVVPKSNVQVGEVRGRNTGGGDDFLRRMRAKQAGRSGRR